jgi:hypothetical protein
MKALATSFVMALLACAGLRAAEPILKHNPDGFYQKRGRVDPFTLGRRQYPPPKRVNLVEVDYAGAEQLLSSDFEDRFERCLAECRRQIPVVDSEIRKLRSVPQADPELLEKREALLEKLKRLAATARRLGLRQEIAAEFAGLKLSVDGIVCRREHASAAVVNGELVRPGSELKPAGARGPTLEVRRIARTSVTFIYRGMEFSVTL